MNQTYLITGSPSPVFVYLVKRLLDQHHRVIVLQDEQSESLALPKGLDNELLIYRANPRSALSVRSVLLNLQNPDKPDQGEDPQKEEEPESGEDSRLKTEKTEKSRKNPKTPEPTSEIFVDHYIHLYHPSNKGSTLSDVDTMSLDRFVDTSIKGALFPLREMLGYFQHRGAGSLTMACVGGLENLLPPLEAAVFGSLYELGKSLFALYQNEPLVLRGLHATIDMGAEEVGESILELIQTDNPKTRLKWNRAGAKTGIFGMRR